ncbi:MAG: hypothetical protein KDA96_15590 [Planctomycetaceae bacterium]|nr:hypothetical protein [Planctomycetaceae bacterium]
MVKKTLAVVAAASVLGLCVFGTDFLSYVRTFGSNAREAVKSQISADFELDRIRDEVDSLMPEVHRHMTIVAEQSVDVKDLEDDLADKESSLRKQKDAILALRSDLETGKDHFTYRAVSYTRSEVESDLAVRFDSYRMAEDSIKRDRQILAAQRDTLRANQKKLDTMLARKEELKVKVAQLEARQKQIQAAEAVHSIEIDDSRLAHVETMIKDLNHALDVRESLLETEGHVLGRIPVEADDNVSDHTSIAAEIDAHFGTPTDAAVAKTDGSSI